MNTLPATPNPAGFYVSPTGSDSNAGTLAAPFATLERAQQAMQASSIKTTYVEGGTYHITNMLTLTAADNGETWQYNPADGVDTAILDASGMSFSKTGNSNVILIEGGSNITINGLQIENSPGGGITIHGGASAWGLGNNMYAATGNATGNTIENCVIHDGAGGGGPFHTGDGQNAAGIYSTMLPGLMGMGNVQNTSFLHNVVYNWQTTGIAFACGDTSPGSFSNSVVSGNVIYNVNISGGDTGGIYAIDTSGTLSTGLQITNNYLRDIAGVSNTGQSADAIYLDYATSGVTVSGNVFTGTYTDGIHINNGSNNVFSGNIFDMGPSGTKTLLKLQDFNSSGGLTGNIFKNNIVTANNASRFGTFLEQINTRKSVTFQNNDYYNYGGGPTMGETRASHIDPEISGWTYTISSGSAIYGHPVNFPGIKGGWGPPGYAIPESGTAPSSV